MSFSNSEISLPHIVISVDESYCNGPWSVTRSLKLSNHGWVGTKMGDHPVEDRNP